MGQLTNTTLADEFAAALEWWRGAGVDCDFDDEPTQWLAEEKQNQQHPGQSAKNSTRKSNSPEAPAAKARSGGKGARTNTSETAPIIGGDKSSWPAELAEFQKWLVSSTEIDPGGAYPAIAPRGVAKPKLMIITPEPEISDRDQLLSGDQGKFLIGMMRAAGIEEGDIYIASALRRHTPLPDWGALASAGLGDLLAHHIKLVAPERILSFGRNIPPLLGNDMAQGAAALHNFNHDGCSISWMGASSLGELLRSANRRRGFWQRWLDWTDN